MEVQSICNVARTLYLRETCIHGEQRAPITTHARIYTHTHTHAQAATHYRAHHRHIHVPLCVVHILLTYEDIATAESKCVTDMENQTQLLLTYSDISPAEGNVVQMWKIKSVNDDPVVTAFAQAKNTRQSLRLSVLTNLE